MSALQCPSCGATHEPRNPGIQTLVCDNCDTTLYLEEDIVRQGKRAKVAQPKSGMAVGKAGRVEGRGLELVGRARFQYDSGYWDEWYVVFDDGTEGWLVEDGRSYTLEEQLAELPEGASPNMGVGDQIIVGDITYEVREKGLTTCVGGEGQLPRNIEPLAVYLYMDCSEINGTGRLLFEFEEDGTGEAFVGLAVDPSTIDIDGVEPPMPGGGREADTIRCAQCASPVTVPAQGDPVETLACTACDAILQLTETDNIVIGNRPNTPDFVLDVGDSGELFDQTWEVVGRLRYYEDGYDTDEFLLWSETDNGYLWLEYDDNHFVANRRALSGPALDDVFVTPKKGSVKVGNETYKLRTSGTSTLTYVDGALPWAAHIGNRFEYVELIKPPKLHVIEGGRGEVEHFTGEWVDAKQVLEAFGRSDRYEKPSEDHFLQPNGCASWIPIGIVAMLFFVVNLCLCMGTGTGVPLSTVTVSETQFGEAVYSEPFDIPGSANVLELDVRGTVDNGWAYAQVELIPMTDETDTLALTGLEVNHYSGFEDGEYWVEDSRKSTKTFRAPAGGRYKMAVITEGDKRANMQVTLIHSSMLTRYNCCVGSFALIFGMLVFLGYWSTESGRYDTE